MKKSKNANNSLKGQRTSQSLALPIAIIDVGSTSVRMLVAQPSPNGGFSTLDSLWQVTNLGRDTFTKGYIEKSSIEECVGVLKNFLTVLEEYGVRSRDNIIAFATSAVREASNSQEFLDRVFVATGIAIRIIDELGINRFIFLALQPFFVTYRHLCQGHTIILEPGGGNTQVLLLYEGNVTVSRSFRQGAYRIRGTFERFNTPGSKLREVFSRQIDKSIKTIRNLIKTTKNLSLVVMGGDIRFAAAHINPSWDKISLLKIKTRSLEKFTEEVLRATPEEIAERYNIALNDAETLGPALLVPVALANDFALGNIYVTSASVREGILNEITMKESWSTRFYNQIITATMELGRKFTFDSTHAINVAEFSKMFFSILGKEHGMGARYEIILTVAALLHDIGTFINTSSHHKHSYYIIRNSKLFGLSETELEIAALVARYHRRALPSMTHPEFAALNRENRIAVMKMAALLRIADALDRNHRQELLPLQIKKHGNRLLITTNIPDDITIEQMAIRDKGDLCKQLFGLTPVLRKGHVEQRRTDEAA